MPQPSKAARNLPLQTSHSFSWSPSIVGEVDLIGPGFMIARGVMTFDRYVLAFFETCFKRPFQVDDRTHQGSLKLDIFLGNFHTWWCLLESELFLFLYLQYVVNKVTILYAERKASLNNSCFGLWLWRYHLFVVTNVVKCKILWPDDNFLSSIVTLL